MNDASICSENQRTEILAEKPVVSVIWGLLLPPAVTLLSVVAVLNSAVLTDWSDNFRQQLMCLLVISGMTLMCSTLFFSYLPIRCFGARLKEFRFCLFISALATLFALLMGGHNIAEMSDSNYGYYDYEAALFLFLPLLAICIPPLWLAVRKVGNRLTRVLVIGGFLTATVLVQTPFLKSGCDYQDERTWMLNSLLVGLAFAIWLCAWGAKDFRRV